MNGIGWSSTGIRTFLCIAILLCTGCQKQQPRQAQQTPLPFQKAIEKQRKLPAAEITALQDLRLLGAVQTTYFSRKQSYATAPELKAAGFLDPAWPRSAPAVYSIEIKLGNQGSSFEVFADPAAQGLGYYRLDESQVVRTEPGGRPSAASPSF